MNFRRNLFLAILVPFVGGCADLTHLQGLKLTGQNQNGSTGNSATRFIVKLKTGSSGGTLAPLTPNANPEDVLQGLTVEPVFTRSGSAPRSNIQKRPTVGAAVAESSGDQIYIANLTEAERTRLAHDPRVEYIEVDNQIKLAGTITNDPLAARQYALDQINVAQAWQVTRGDNHLEIGLCDSGATPAHEDLVGVYSGMENFTSYDDTAEDLFGHGTHVAGIMAANANNGKGITGIAPNVRIYSGRVIDSNDSGWNTWLARCLRAATDRQVVAINLSLVGFYGQTVLAEVQRAIDHGIPVVVAAGNGNSNVSAAGTINSLPGVITVAGTDENYDLFRNSATVGSNYGAWITMAAPGHLITSTIPGNIYQDWTGTSMAAPMVTATIALMKSVNPRLTPLEVTRFLKSAAMPIRPAHDSENVYSFLNVGNAINTSAWAAAGYQGAMAQNITAFGWIDSTPDKGYNPSTNTIKMAGWVNDPELFSSTLLVQLKADDQTDFMTVAEIPASYCRNDLIAAHVANNCQHGFNLDFPVGDRHGHYKIRYAVTDYNAQGTAVGEVVLRGTGLNGVADNFDLNLPLISEGSVAFGVVDAFEYLPNENKLHVRGWAWDQDLLQNSSGYTQLPLRIFYKFVGEMGWHPLESNFGFTGTYRPDTVGHGPTDPFHGYDYKSLPLPTWMAGTNVEFMVGVVDIGPDGNWANIMPMKVNPTYQGVSFRTW